MHTMKHMFRPLVETTSADRFVVFGWSWRFESDRGVGESGSQSPNGDGEAWMELGLIARILHTGDRHIAVARWIEQVLPFSLLLLVVFIQQHLQDTLVRQAAMVLKCILLMYYKNSRGRNYCRQAMSRKESHYSAYATSEQAAMVLKCILLMYYKNSSGRNYRRQVQFFFAALKALSSKEGQSDCLRNFRAGSTVFIFHAPY
ncbi:hypothetical protein LOK49_LG10G02455 [Camellia lanceoleosa]|uniref:Uncharacterized protein n=1 Tax=Camellia lanceoleosa TaxID=1840588 RepID=A0ACC0GBD2_9ERIC|nr:hypothetical protein LOK49_LG10G02455 [Camellia lanceoleosa]